MLAAILQGVFGKMRPFLANSVAPVSGPPVARTEGDRWLIDEFGEYLEPGERLQHVALATNFAPGSPVERARSLFVGPSDRRLVLLDARLGLTARVKGAETFSAHPRRDIARVVQDQLQLFFTFAGGAVLVWIAPNQRRSSNRWLLARDVPRQVGAEIDGTVTAPPGATVRASP